MNDSRRTSGFDTLNQMTSASLTSRRLNSAVALLVAMSLGATACAGATDTAIAPAAEVATTETLAPTTTAKTEAEPETPATEAAEPASSVSAEETTTTLLAAPAVAFDLPDVDLTEISTGNTVNLTNVADGKPLVLWFFAPH